ncbi:PEP-CTERM sorting domain-containing protein [Duganella sp. BJB475]|nr:PEP-CTERM sorting domain-containing protein [Duganella sp. BJB475]RFP27843.1 PEP-CTERM sorting domain-containing protein [Duganella sp. BJB476]
MVDAEHAVDEAPNSGPSSAQRLELYDDVMMLNHRPGEAAQLETWWRWSPPSPSRSPAAQAYALPPVPEPQGYLLWLAGLALLALAARRRAQRR